MLTLTASISVPNLTKIKVVAVSLDVEAAAALVTCKVQGAGGAVYSVVALNVRDGASDGLRGKPSPVGYTDIVEVFPLSTPTGFTDLVTAYTGGIAARNKAAETALQTAGVLPMGTVA